MTDIRSDAVDVEQLMRQIRARIREKRGADFSDAELQQLAGARLDALLSPRGGRGDLAAEFRRPPAPAPEPPSYTFEDTTLYESHRGPLRFIRKLLNPILKLFINPNPLIAALHTQAEVNASLHKRLRKREEMDALVYEVVQQLVTEVTRATLEAQSLKMRVESLSTRMDFDERRAKAMEGQTSPRQAPAPRPSSPSHAQPQGQPGPDQPVTGGNGRPDAGGRSDGPGAGNGERRRRRRRRRRRSGQGGSGAPAAGAETTYAMDGGEADSLSDAASSSDDDGFDGDDTSDSPDQ